MRKPKFDLVEILEEACLFGVITLNELDEAFSFLLEVLFFHMAEADGVN